MGRGEFGATHPHKEDKNYNATKILSRKLEGQQAIVPAQPKRKQPYLKNDLGSYIYFNIKK